MSGQLAVSGASSEAIDEAKHLFDPNVLTLGFARRFATYKRPNLLLHDPQRLLSLSMNDLDPQAVRVELYADGGTGGAPVRHEMKRIRSASGTYVYGAAVSGGRPETDYMARVIPNYDGVTVPLEVGPILWQR